MYPLKAILICNDQPVLMQLRRELAKQDVTIAHECPNVTAAIHELHLNCGANYLLICQLDDAEHADALRQLSGLFSDQAIVALVDRGVSCDSILHLMRDGASQVVMLPLAATDFQEALERIEIQFGHAANQTNLIAVSAAIGGVGSTTLAVNLAYEIAQQHQRDTILAELPSQAGVLDSFLAIDAHFTLADVFAHHHAADVCSIKKALAPFGDRLSVLVGAPAQRQMHNLDTSELKVLIHSLRQLADVVVLDVPATPGNGHQELLAKADHVLLVTDQTVPALHATQRSLEMGIADLQPLIVVNKFDDTIDGFSVAALRHAFALPEIDIVAYDHHGYINAINCGQPLRSIHSGSPAVHDTALLASKLLGKPRTPQSTKTSWSSGLIARFAHALSG